jgi:broad specificity phosphatase PhoE
MISSVSTAQPEVYLIRHGETEWSRAKRHSGHTDLDLMETGVQQAIALRPVLADINFDLVLTSPLLRARRTADMAGFADRYELEPDLMEWDYGDFEGLTAGEIRQQQPDWRIWTDGVAGGESAAELMERLGRVTERIRRGDVERVLCFAHGHSLRVLTLTWLGLEIAHGALFPLQTATISVLGWEKESPAIVRWNAPPGR